MYDNHRYAMRFWLLSNQLRRRTRFNICVNTMKMRLASSMTTIAVPRSILIDDARLHNHILYVYNMYMYRTAHTALSIAIHLDGSTWIRRVGITNANIQYVCMYVANAYEKCSRMTCILNAISAADV